MVEKTYKSDDGPRPITHRAFEGVCQKKVDALLRLRVAYAKNFRQRRRFHGETLGRIMQRLKDTWGLALSYFPSIRQTSGSLSPKLLGLDTVAASQEGTSIPQRPNQPFPPRRCQAGGGLVIPRAEERTTDTRRQLSPIRI